MSFLYVAGMLARLHFIYLRFSDELPDYFKVIPIPNVGL